MFRRWVLWIFEEKLYFFCVDDRVCGFIKVLWGYRKLDKCR